jgi:hypothetical protein
VRESTAILRSPKWSQECSRHRCPVRFLTVAAL